MSTTDCVFCKIIGGSIPALKILETADALAFLDINPLAHGHCLLVPKRHVQGILDVPADSLAGLIAPLPRLAKALLQATDASGLNILQNTGESSGQAVFHLHFHLIPRIDGDKLGYRWNAGAYASGEGERLRDRLIDELGD